MFDNIQAAIKKLVEEIYTADQINVNNCFVEFLDEIEIVIKELEQIGFLVDLTEEMKILQGLFKKRDLVELSDYLLYELSPSFEKLKYMVSEAGED